MADPVNPSDVIQQRGVKIVQAQPGTLRRPFQCVTKNPFFYRDGPGTDEFEGAHRNTTPDPWDPYAVGYGGGSKPGKKPKDPNGIY